MPSKRTSSSGSKVAAPATKKQCGAAAAATEPVATCDPLLDACAPVLKVLQNAEAAIEAGSSAADLLCAALPFALRATGGIEQRHEYQDKMLDVIATQLSNIAASRDEVVVALEKEATHLQADKNQSTAIQEEIAGCLTAKTKERDDAMEASKKQQVVVNEAQVTLEIARKAVEVADAEKLGLEKDRDDFIAGFTEVWAPLKNAEISGRQWREREKLLGKLAEKMHLASAEPSLLMALLVALKLKPDARSEFAQTTLAHAEELYKKHIEVLRQRVENFHAETTARGDAVTEAEAAAKAAQEALDAAMDADIVAQNAWVEVVGEDSDHTCKMKAYGPKAAKLQEQLAQVRAEASHLREVCVGFDAIRPVGAILRKKAVENTLAPDSGTGVVAGEAPRENEMEEAPVQVEA